MSRWICPICRWRWRSPSPRARIVAKLHLSVSGVALDTAAKTISIAEIRLADLTTGVTLLPIATTTTGGGRGGRAASAGAETGKHTDQRVSCFDWRGRPRQCVVSFHGRIGRAACRIDGRGVQRQREGADLRSQHSCRCGLQGQGEQVRAVLGHGQDQPAGVGFVCGSGDFVEGRRIDARLAVRREVRRLSAGEWGAVVRFALPRHAAAN